jgi:antitoxin HicB
MLSGMKGYTVVLAWDEAYGGFVVTCPAMPGLATQGPDREEALEMASEAMLLWLETARVHGDVPLNEDARLVASHVAHALEWQAEEGWPLRVETTTLLPSAAQAA